ncbi:MAG TPA: hypothetical protein ENI87_08365 [bacterium]|nr:hypothetical protein [bacterium]
MLELGGEQPSLRAQLVAMGRTVAAPRPAAPPSDAPPLDVPDPLPGPEPRPEPQLEPQSEWVLVELPPGETLIHLARRHLGDGRRFVDLLRWNGWTEQDARRLPEGQAVRVKRAELAQR